MKIHYYSFQERIKLNGSIMAENDPRIQYGPAFVQLCGKTIRTCPVKPAYGQTPEDAARQMVFDVQKRCRTFLVRALKELDERIPDSWNLFKNLGSLTPAKMMSVNRTPLTSLPFQQFMGNVEKLTKIDQQYRSFRQHDWAEDSIFESSGVPDDVVTFFGTLRDHVDSGGELDFQELSDYVLDTHCLPLSNCFVENIFSMSGYIKNKWRNSTSLAVLDSLVRIKSHLNARSICCRDLQVTKSMLEKHSTEMYDFKKKKEIDLEKESQELEEIDYFAEKLQFAKSL